MHQAELDLAEALPAEVGRQVRGPQPALLDLLLQRRVDAVEGAWSSSLNDRLDRPDLLAHELAHPVQLLLELGLGREVPRHGLAVLRGRAIAVGRHRSRRLPRRHAGRRAYTRAERARPVQPRPRLVAALVAGCGGLPTTSTVLERPRRRPRATAFDDCRRPGPAARARRGAPPPGERLPAVVLGRGGSTGVVFANPSASVACGWLPCARAVARDAVRSIVVELRRLASREDEVLAAARWLRAHGATRVVLVAGSIGGRAVVTAAARGGPRQVDAVVSLSGERILGAQRDLLVDARRLRVPVLLGQLGERRLHRPSRARRASSTAVREGARDRTACSSSAATTMGSICSPDAGAAGRPAVTRFIRRAPIAPRACGRDALAAAGSRSSAARRRPCGVRAAFPATSFAAHGPGASRPADRDRRVVPAPGGTDTRTCTSARSTLFEGPPPAYPRTSLDHAPRAPAPRAALPPEARGPAAETGRPLWVDDPNFNLEYHVRHTALPEPGSEEQLLRLAGADLLPAARPLQAAVGDVARRGPRRTAASR